MAQQLQNITIAAPAFKGLNTQDSPLNADPSFAAVADNCVIDKYGRIGVRKGFDTLTSDVTALGGNPIRVLHVFEDESGNEVIFSAGNNKLFSGTSTLTDETPASYTISSNNWQIVNFNNHCYFFQRGYEPLVYSTADGAIIKMSSDANAVGTPPQANTALAAFGRLWVADLSGDKQTVYWSDLLNGAGWSGGSSGSINLAKVWPDGYDEVVALAAHNSFLIIFGRNSIVIYGGAEDPATMALADTVAGIGCIQRDTVQYTGSDVIFLSHVGVQSFGRLVQQKSLPLNNLSKNIRNDLLTLIASEGQPIKSVYSPENSFYLLLLEDNGVIYCFDTRGTLEDGSARVTRWVSTPFVCLAAQEDGTLYVGGLSGVGIYRNYSDDGSGYSLRYYSNPLTFGDSSRTKFLKKIIPTLIGGGSTNVFVKWAYDFSDSYTTASLVLTSVTGSEYGVAEYNIGEYSSTNVAITKKGINASGSGTVVTIGVEAEISGQSFSLQEFNIQALLGRLL